MIGAALTTQGLVKRYGRRRALDGFTLSVPQGALMGLVGPNGAGKTTWMMTVAGFLRPSAGVVDILGRGPFDARLHAGRFSILPQDSELPLEAHVAGLLIRYARLAGLSATAARSAVSDILAAVNLSDRATSTIRSLSHGMRKRVMLAQCFLGSPEIILLDEPLNGLDPVERDRIRNFILSFRGKRTIVVSSHELHDVEYLCSHVAFVEKGRVARTSVLSALTRASRRVTYGLTCEPVDYSALVQALPGTEFSWDGRGKVLVCTVPTDDLAAANRVLLPVLLCQTDILSITAGQSLEDAYLNR